MGALFSKKNKEVFSTPLGLNNPVTVQVLGIGSSLAVTAKAEQIPSTCTVTGLFMPSGAENTSLFFFENNCPISLFLIIIG